MGLLSSILRGPELRADYRPWDDFWYHSVAGVGTAVGIPVTPLVALQVAAVFACVQVKAETLATLPLITYRRRPGRGKDRAPEHPLYEILHDSPNGWQTSVEFLEDMEGLRVLHGNCFAEIVPGPLGAVGELLPIRPELVTVEQLPNHRLRYQVRQPDGASRPLTQDQVFHVRGRSLDFVRGLSTQTQARDAIALARAIELYGARFFANDASIGLMLEHPGTLSEKAHARIKESLATLYSGVGNAHKPKILEEGMKASRIAMTAAKDAQLTEAEASAVVTICRYFRVQPHKIQHLLHATFSNIEHQGIEFVTDTMLPSCRRWEARINTTLITDNAHFAEFLLAGLMRGDNAARSAYYQSRFNIGSLSINDIRELENENPLPGHVGDRYFVQGALVPVDRIDRIVDDRARGAGSAGRADADDAEDEEDEEKAARTAAEERPAALVARAPVRAFRLLVADAAERIARAEAREIAKRVDKAAADPARFMAWLVAFASEHAGYVARTLDPLRAAWAAETGLEIPGAELTADVMAGSFALTGSAAPDTDFAEWAAARPGVIAARLSAAFSVPETTEGSTASLARTPLEALIDERLRRLLAA